jgi:hypothetical protein
MSDGDLAFPYAATLVAPLRAASEEAGSPAYLQMWAGHAAGLSKAIPADRFTRELAANALALLQLCPVLRAYFINRFGLKLVTSA